MSKASAIVVFQHFAPEGKYCSCSLSFYDFEGVPSADTSARCCFKWAIITVLNSAIGGLSPVLLWPSLHPSLTAQQLSEHEGSEVPGNMALAKCVLTFFFLHLPRFTNMYPWKQHALGAQLFLR